MTIIEGGIAFLGLLFATVLSGLALWGRISRWLDAYEANREERFKEMVLEAMTERGLVKPGDPRDIWPNGSDNMVDFLTTLWESMEAAQAGLHALRGRVAGYDPRLTRKKPETPSRST